ncbi:hypothetical protein BDN72DRAFT_881520 [Pluteus cervinus]|uniref:Uncharacterized protein n=1 Tax=Pluteus cervinus TaxID=181527 RepID=A0ACD3AFD1_9AGAR|nr:hypothetical protein BDN72DRAFT_881520 [Pluteus cervinus]
MNSTAVEPRTDAMLNSCTCDKQLVLAVRMVLCYSVRGHEDTMLCNPMKKKILSTSGKDAGMISNATSIVEPPTSFKFATNSNSDQYGRTSGRTGRQFGHHVRQLESLEDEASTAFLTPWLNLRLGIECDLVSGHAHCTTEFVRLARDCYNLEGNLIAILSVPSSTDQIGERSPAPPSNFHNAVPLVLTSTPNDHRKNTQGGVTTRKWQKRDETQATILTPGSPPPSV